MTILQQTAQSKDHTAAADTAGSPKSVPDARSLQDTSLPSNLRLSLEDITRHLFVPMLAAVGRLLDGRVVQSLDDIRLAMHGGLGMNPRCGDLLDWAGRHKNDLLHFCDKHSLPHLKAEIRHALTAADPPSP